MRRAILLLPILLFAGCKAEPDFDARYDKAAKEIEARAAALDADVDEAAPADSAGDKQSAPTGP